MPSSQSLPNALDFAHYQGDTFRRYLIFDTDIVGWAWQGDIRRACADEAATIEASFTFTPVDSKELTISLTSAQTAAMTGRYVYDIEGTLPAGDVVTVLAGTLTIRCEVSL
ncbi:MAG TPA: hypothetical protein VID94_09820 [Acidimicrobiales bacterium]|jgi:hypothetical protein